MHTARRVVKLSAALAAATAMLAITAGSANAAVATVYDNSPSPLPGNLPSVGYEATATSEFGGQVEFASTERDRPTVRITLSSWACQSGAWNLNNCSTTPGATFDHPIRVNVYKVQANNEPGRLIGAVTRTLTMPYRRSANFTHCTGMNAGKWYRAADATCYNGRAFSRSIGLGDLQLPDKAIISVEYNTSNYGYEPIGTATPCYTASGGCPYDSLNVAVTSPPAPPTPAPPPSVGAYPLPDDAYVNGSNAVSYCDGGAGGLGTFRLDAGCWTGFQPVFRMRAQ